MCRIKGGRMWISITNVDVAALVVARRKRSGRAGQRVRWGKRKDDCWWFWKRGVWPVLPETIIQISVCLHCTPPSRVESSRAGFFFWSTLTSRLCVFLFVFVFVLWSVRLYYQTESHTRIPDDSITISTAAPLCLTCYVDSALSSRTYLVQFSSTIWSCSAIIKVGPVLLLYQSIVSQLVELRMICVCAVFPGKLSTHSSHRLGSSLTTHSSRYNTNRWTSLVSVLLLPIFRNFKILFQALFYGAANRTIHCFRNSQPQQDHPIWVFVIHCPYKLSSLCYVQLFLIKLHTPSYTWQW